MGSIGSRTLGREKTLSGGKILGGGRVADHPRPFEGMVLAQPARTENTVPFHRLIRDGIVMMSEQV